MNEQELTRKILYNFNPKPCNNREEPTFSTHCACVIACYSGPHTIGQPEGPSYCQYFKEEVWKCPDYTPKED